MNAEEAWRAIGATQVIYADGSGSTRQFWESRRGRSLLAYLRTRNLRVRPAYWLTVGVYPISERPDYGGSAFRVAKGHFEEQRIAWDSPDLKAVYITDDEGHRDFEHFVQSADCDFMDRNCWTVITFNELENKTVNDYEYFAREVRDLELQLDQILDDVDNQQRRNKLAIELHTKLDRIANDLASKKDLRHRVLQVRVQAMTDAVLEEVFRVKSQSKLIRVLDEAFFNMPRASQVSTNESAATVQDQYANDDVAGVTVKFGTLEFTGSAKRNPADTPDPEIGLLVARAKAFQKLASHLKVEANGAVAASDKVRRQEQAAKNQRRADNRRAERKAREARSLRDAEAEVKTLRAELAARTATRPVRKPVVRKTTKK